MSFHSDAARNRRLGYLPRPQVACPKCGQQVFPVAITASGNCFRCDSRTEAQARVRQARAVASQQCAYVAMGLDQLRERLRQTPMVGLVFLPDVKMGRVDGLLQEAAEELNRCRATLTKLAEDK